MKSPNWLEEEVILALDLYARRDFSWINKMSDSTFEIVALSKLLNGLDLHLKKPDNFRSTGSVRMKISNFMALDKRYSGQSLGHVSDIDKKVWEKYKNDFVSLHEKCKEIISKHLSISDCTVDKYVNEMDLKSRNTYDNDFADFSRLIIRELPYYENLAILNPNNENASHVLDSCKEIRKVLEWAQEKEKINFENGFDYKEHAGVNLKPVDNSKKEEGKTNNSEEKIGNFIKRTFNELVEQDKLTEEIIEKLLLPKYSHDQFGLKPTFLIEVNDEEKIREQIMDQNGYVRYWTKPILIHGKKYCVCKEWYENQREKYLRWLSSVNKHEFYMLSPDELKSILEYLKEVDSKEVNITRQAIVNKFPIETIQEVIKILLEIGILDTFQGSAREYVIDDYDALFRMLKQPEKYSGGK